MKKLVLFASAMLLCAGITMAQEPVKKDNKKAETTAVAKPAKSEAQAAHKGCGNCPNHKQCGKAAGAQAAVAKPEAAKPCCKKDGQKACNKDGQKACNKEAAVKTANKNAEAKPTAKK